MLLGDLKTEEAKAAFIALAYAIAKADGSLDYAEITLIKLYLEEMGAASLPYQSPQESVADLCHVFSDQHARNIVFFNLLSLALVDGCDNAKQKDLLGIIQRELAVSSIEVKRHEEEMKIIQGSYFPHYFD